MQGACRWLPGPGHPAAQRGACLAGLPVAVEQHRKRPAIPGRPSHAVAPGLIVLVCSSGRWRCSPLPSPVLTCRVFEFSSSPPFHTCSPGTLATLGSPLPGDQDTRPQARVRHACSAPLCTLPELTLHLAMSSNIHTCSCLCILTLTKKKPLNFQNRVPLSHQFISFPPTFNPSLGTVSERLCRRLHLRLPPGSCRAPRAASESPPVGSLAGDSVASQPRGFPRRSVRQLWHQ